jgi:EAL and modified HD-GYP domain-containing signal transduction protein
LNKLYLAKQKIFNRQGKLFAYELLFRDHEFGIKNFPTNIKATSQVIMNTLSNINTDDLLGKDGIAFLNIDDKVFTSGIIDILDKDRFVLEILETTDLNEKVILKIKQYHKRGFKIAIDDFDCSAEMIKKFNPIFKLAHIVKIDVMAAEEANLKGVMLKLKSLGIKVLAEKIETAEEYKYYLDMGFDLFQGYYLNKPEIIEVENFKGATQMVILNLIKLIRDQEQTAIIENYIKQRADLSFKLVQFINNQGQFDNKVESISHIITLLGRDKLLRWLLLYMYAEFVTDPLSESIMNIATKRAEKMEAEAPKEEKDKAYLAGMFSMLDALFDTSIENVMKNIKVDKDINDLVLLKSGKFLSSFRKAEFVEREYLKKLIINNFDKINTADILSTLELNKIHIDKDKF